MVRSLPERVARLEQVFLGDGPSSCQGGLLGRIARLEELCLGQSETGALPQRLRQLEVVTFGEEIEVLQVAAAQVAGPARELPAPEHQAVEQPEVFALPVAKRPRPCLDRLREAQTFQLEANSHGSSGVALNPAAFKQYPLREEQLRSLAWMYSREAREEGLKGGLLADKMGYGKTATTIGLLSESRGESQSPEGYIYNPATLILCPPHLVGQWEDEFFKFLGDGAAQLHRPTSSKSRKDRKQWELAPIEVTDQFSLKLAGNFVIEIGPAVLRQQAVQKGHQRLQVGDEIVKMTVHPKPGETFSVGGIPIPGQPRTAVRGFQHFLDKECEQGRSFHLLVKRDTSKRTSAVRGEGAFRILSIANNSDLVHLRLKDLQGSGEDGAVPVASLIPWNVVLVSTGILASPKHFDRLRKVLISWVYHARCRDWLPQYVDRAFKGMRMHVRQEKLRECVKLWHAKACHLEGALFASPVLLEAIWWHRMVLDEFHESESWKTAVREVMKSLGATHRWGLSGTPPLNSTDSVLEVAELLWYATDGGPDAVLSPAMSKALKYRQSTKTAAKSWLAKTANQEEVQKECQVMIRDFVRQNESTLVKAIRIVEHEEFFSHTAEERLIYRQACHDHHILESEAAYQGASLDAKEALLKRCAHFSLDMEACDATAAVRLLGARKRARIQSLQKQLEMEACRAVHLKSWDVSKAGLLEGVHHPEAKLFLQKIHGATSAFWAQKHDFKASLELLLDLYDKDGQPRLRPEVRFHQPLREADIYQRLAQRHLVQHTVAKVTNHPRAQQILAETQVCSQVCCGDNVPGSTAVQRAMLAGFQTLAKALDLAHRSLDFYMGQIRGRQHQCSICLDVTNDLSLLVMLPCSHVFHRACVVPILENSSQCPLCRAAARSNGVSSVLLELEAGQSEPGAAAAEELSPELRQHGSKLLRVAQRLQKIRQEDPKAKAIVFVQWYELEHKVAAALTSHGLAAWQIPRGAQSGRQMTKVMKDFCASQESFVLLLSLEHAASGTNLTAANHVIFVHPMNAETLSTAVAYERQALARVRRVGQERSEVHVWRFIAKDTVEEYMHKLHRATPSDDVTAAAGGA